MILSQHLRCKSCCLFRAFFIVIVSSITVVASETGFHFEKGNHIVFIGNALAERMQHDGWVETAIQSRLPGYHLVFRNRGFSGDEIKTRFRSAGFGGPDEHLTTHKTDVVFAFFGYNESFAGKEGLQKFHKELTEFIKHTLSQKYNGKSSPKLVLFSPIAHEDLQNPNLPNGKANNVRLELYTRAMRKIAKKNGVTFVDLFHPTQAAYKKSQANLTINGVHLNSYGNRIVAEIIDRAFFPNRPNVVLDTTQTVKIRNAVQDKNFYWFQRYHTTDGYNVYGGRSHLKFVDGITNRVSMQREMKILDAMTALRDERVWAIAQGRDLKIDDSKTPAFIPIKTNKPGPLPGGKYKFLGGEEAIGKMTLAKGMKVNLFASEEMFPDLVSPVQMAFDSKGRLWVAVWPSYPHWTPKDEMNDKLIVLEDTDGDGKADKSTTFAGGLRNPTGFEFWNGGVIVAMAPYLLFLKDTDGDGIADVRERILQGIDSADTHHTANSFVLSPGGALFFQEGTFHQSQIETVDGTIRNHNACVWRFNPRTWDVDRYIPFNFANPHGHVFDRWGQDFVHDGTGAVPYHAVLFSGHLDMPMKHPKPPQLYRQRTRPCGGTEILSSSQFPARNQGNLLIANVIGFQGIQQYKFEDNGSSFSATEIEPILFSSDPNFRPVDMEVGPDGALYFVDWHNPLIGHMQHHIRDPNRDKIHGRVYRVTYENRPLLKAPKIAHQPIPDLLELLKSREDRVRYRTRIELSGRKTDAVIAAVDEWVKKLDPADKDYEHHRLEALWIHQHHNVVNETLLKQVLRSPDYRARAAATRVLCYWLDKVKASDDLLQRQADDKHPRVRLEAVRAASFLRSERAPEIALTILKHSTDKYLDFTLSETMRQLEPWWKKAIASGKPFAENNPAAMQYLLAKIPTPDLVKAHRNKAIFTALLNRHQIAKKYRQEALAGLANLNGTSEMQELLQAIKRMDANQMGHANHVLYDLALLLTEKSQKELGEVRNELDRMADSSKKPLTKQIGYVALSMADRSTDRVWQKAIGSVGSLKRFLEAIPLIPDDKLRSGLYSRVNPLLAALPQPLNQKVQHHKGTFGRFVRIELPGKRRILTLAEVQVYIDGKNVARNGRASQKSTAFGGVASRAIDGNADGVYGRGSQTHSKEPDRKPWWEVDLGQEFPIEKIVVWNRSERNGLYAKRLDRFTVKVLDAQRKPVFEKKRNKAPATQVAFLLQGDPAGSIRHSAMNALTYMPGHEAVVCRTLSKMLMDAKDRHEVVLALHRIPKYKWPKELVRPVVDDIVAHVAKVPPKQRVETQILDELQLGNDLAAILPATQAKRVRSQLGKLGVQIIMIRPVPLKMLFDRTEIAVEAGKPVQIVFENIDIMPHNLVITNPGKMKEIGMAAERMATQPDAYARQFIPSSPDVLFHTRLLQSRETQKLRFIAPTKTGDYSFVCTFPGHWRRMYGVMHVVKDLEEFLASHPLQQPTQVGNIRPFVKDWKYEDLFPHLGEVDSGRSFKKGKQLFTSMSCVQCHKNGGEGGIAGPDLVKRDLKMKRADLLWELINPSKVIKKNYQSWVIVDTDGKQTIGMILSEDKKKLTLMPNPLGLDNPKPIEFDIDDIEFKKPSKVSLMPEKLLNTMTLEEILDLIAFLEARGSSGHRLYRR